ncbi:MviM Predicted dehydrogenases and related proteins [Candidatus Nanopelagicaceae bacterium]
MKVGIAGYGLAGRSFHGALLKSCGFDVSAILTTNATRARQAKEDFPTVKIAESIEALLACELDLVVIATTNDVHASLAIACIKAGIPVVVDKPFARNFKETENVLEASNAASVPVTVFFNRLWDSDTLTIKKVLGQGLIGKPFRFDSRYERFRPTISPTSWRESTSPENGGGLLLDLQTHLLSIALHLFGKSELTYASVRDIRGNSEDDVALTLRHNSGVDSYLVASAISGAPGPRIRLLGTEGALVIHDLDPQEPLLRSGELPENGIWNLPTSSRAFLHRGEIVEEIDGVPGNYGNFYLQVKGALAGENAWPITHEEILDVAQMIDKAREVNVR